MIAVGLISNYYITENRWVSGDYLVLWVLAVFSLRVFWNSAALIHGLGHSLIKALVDGDVSSLTLVSILENRNPTAVLRSCLPLQPIILPTDQRPNLPWIAVGDSTPWKVRCKAAGGLLFNLLALELAANINHGLLIQRSVDLSSSPTTDVLSIVIVIFTAANAFAVISSWSDLVSMTTGRADYFYCGNFGFIARKTHPMTQGLIDQSWLDLFKTMGRETEVRGEQAGGGLTLAQDHSGRSYFVGDKIVNAKRSNLTQSLELVFYRTRDRAWRAGFRPRQDNVLGVWHYRLGTSGPPSVLETHWHEWTPPRLEMVWQLKNGQWINSIQNVNHRITHNGDFEAWQLFGELVDYKTLGLWLERVLDSPNQTVGDSPKIAGMIDLLVTQGMWLSSVRLAYQLMIASSVADAFGGEPIAKESPNTAPNYQELKKWAQLCESAFIEHLNQLTSADELTTPDSLYQLQQLIIKNLQQEQALNQINECTLCLFARATIEAFFHNDLYRAAQFFMLRARGSFGLVLVSTLIPDKLILTSLG